MLHLQSSVYCYLCYFGAFQMYPVCVVTSDVGLIIIDFIVKYATRPFDCGECLCVSS